MKSKKIEKLIRQDMHEHTPEVLHRIDFEAIQIEPKEKNAWFSKLIKPVFAPLTAFAILILLLIVFLDIGDGGITPPGNDIIAFSDKEEAYTLSALSAISLLNQLNTDDSNSFLNSNDPVRILLDDHLDQLNRNLLIVEPLIGNKDLMAFNVYESELEAYSYKVVFTSTDLSGRTIDYTMHFNETEEDESTFVIEGLMIINNVSYQLVGELEVHDDGFELDLRADHPSDEDTYVEIKQEVTSEEHTLAYEVVKNGDTLYESELSIEFDGENVSIEIDYESDTLSLSFEIERTFRNNQAIYHIEYDIEDESKDEDESGEITVSVEFNDAENRYYYRYEIEIDDDIFIRYKRRTTVTDSPITETRYMI